MKKLSPSVYSLRVGELHDRLDVVGEVGVLREQLPAPLVLDEEDGVAVPVDGLGLVDGDVGVAVLAVHLVEHAHRGHEHAGDDAECLEVKLSASRDCFSSVREMLF